MKKIAKLIYPLLFILLLLLSACSDSQSSQMDSGNGIEQENNITVQTEQGWPDTEEDAAVSTIASLDNLPPYAGSPYVVIDGNQPAFNLDDVVSSSFEFYSSLDALGRCGVAYANIGQDIMPQEERGAIGQVKPTGWHTVKYDFVEGKYLYNRCHLIGYQLTAENANVRNLITGTRYMNVEGMLPFENMVADYIKETGNHVLYRVTPIFKGSNLLADGVQMEALSLEDQGKGICFNVFCYNVQPGVMLDYTNGDSYALSGTNIAETNLPGDAVGEADDEINAADFYIINVKSRKFHYPTCAGVAEMKEENKLEYSGAREKLIEAGYDPCGMCNP